MTDRVPLAALRPAPWNPRLIHDARFQQLCRSLEADPAFMDERPILATADGTIYAGNMRWRAAQHLGWADVPARLSDIPEQLAKERALRDNNQFGDWQEQELAELLAELQLQDVELESLGFEPWRLNQLVGDGVDDPSGEWRGMPEYEQQDRSAIRTIYVHFADYEAVEAFARLVDQPIANDTKSIWYPAQRPRRLGVYVSDEA